MKQRSSDFRVRQRLAAHQLSTHPSSSPAEVVRALGAIQAQDYAAGQWAIASRLHDATRADIEKAAQAFAIVRTWPMRGTLHYVAAEDVRWMLTHLAPRMRSTYAARHKQLGLEAADFTKAGKALAHALRGKNLLPRPAAMAVMAKAGVAPDGQRGIHVLAKLAQDALLVVGPLVGKQPSFALLEEHVKPAKQLSRESGLALLARRFFATRSPATDKDFARWSGLALQEARAVVDALGPEALAPPAKPAAGMGAWLLAPWDEYTVAYAEREELIDPACAGKLTKQDLLRPVVVVDGFVVGTWTRTLSKKGVDVHVDLKRALKPAEEESLEAARARYARYLGVARV